MAFFKNTTFILLLSVFILISQRGYGADFGIGHGHRQPTMADIFAGSMRRDKMIELIESIERLERAAKMEREKAGEVGLDAGKKKYYEDRAAAFESGMYNASKQLNEHLSPTWGGLLGKSLVEEEQRNYIGVPEDPLSAIAMGTAVNLTTQAGVVFRRRIRGILEELLGGSLDFLTGKIQHLIAELYILLFHGGYPPYTKDTLGDWQLMVRGIFTDVERIIEKGVAAGLRGHDMSARTVPTSSKIEEDLLEQTEGQHVEALVVKEQGDPYKILMGGYVEACQQIVLELEGCKRYYDKGSAVEICATQIQRQLTAFAELLLRSNSVTSLNDVFKSSKIMVVATKNLIDMQFESLKRQIAPRTYSFAGKDSSDQQRRVKPSRNNYMLGDDDAPYPMQF